jgi:hypothetical protein
MGGQPGDKSPGYYRVSVRDEVKTGFQMSKLQGPSGAQTASLYGYPVSLEQAYENTEQEIQQQQRIRRGTPNERTDHCTVESPHRC